MFSTPYRLHEVPLDCRVCTHKGSNRSTAAREREGGSVDVRQSYDVEVVV